MQNETEQRSGYLPVLLIILAIVLFLWFVCWWDAQPKQLLSRFLDVKWSEKMTRIESDYYGGFDMTTHIYLEADAETIRNIIEKGGFTRSTTEPTSESISRLNFGDAPEAHAEPLIHYHRHFQNTVHEYLAVTPDGLRLWYTAVDY
jgi:hypothetical protein